ncbi:MAG: ribosomal RNA small subunit methyltransferase A [Armatimonadetes bacterium]|nr:ribosomal RNA small subunit methyltransferase A [Armatimonadota bacterium]
MTMAGIASDGESLAVRTRRLLAELGRRPRRERGQNFLIDPTLAERVAGLACGDEAPQVLEIGAGLGALTECLAVRAARVVALELEAAFVEALHDVLAGSPHVRIVAGDALKVDLAGLVDGPPDAWRVAANLPYYAASAILVRLLEARPPFERLVVMVQKEVGDRLTARPGDEQYGSLSVFAAYQTEDLAVALRVPRGAFYPQPKVDSVVLSLRPRRAPRAGVLDEGLLLAVIRAGFGQRRKQLANTLVGLGSLDRTSAAAALAEAGIPPPARAEELDLEAFIALSNALSRSGVRASAAS